ncbi:VanZ family protein [Salipaludibacillus neizhouensis]|uniref:VanZ family protein n=1 Tax=Salipaludibacillus neizhouensis TaxID=885475 RepID=UPI001CBA6160|nr:VanZ family protein [Salipaludibacillus neizhouensis]
MICVYLLILSRYILFKYMTSTDIINHFTFNFEIYGPFLENHNFIPLKTIVYYLFFDWEHIGLGIRLSNLIGNILGFIPFGFLFPLLSHRFQKLKVVVIATFSLSLTFELLQLIFHFGSFDFDDLILNTTGGILGYLPLKYLNMLFKNKKKSNVLIFKLILSILLILLIGILYM